ncbi:hypothetical protein NC651_001213 [Populus alba x Populus x berolinensis]|nr:hypothetical protein NC651_001213 [Populus alba x Populus x berolinensis]
MLALSIHLTLLRSLHHKVLMLK